MAKLIQINVTNKKIDYFFLLMLLAFYYSIFFKYKRDLITQAKFNKFGFL
jgi:hypothetical protein